MPIIVLFIISEIMHYLGWPYWKPMVLTALTLATLQSAMLIYYAEKGTWKRRWGAGFFVVLILLAVFLFLGSQGWL
ncbi:MAG: hypothetical protein U5K31_00455 [Balneolaceae bacterium]|nr:hypothetical protein [Balneolaceae bacterium]